MSPPHPKRHVCASIYACPCKLRDRFAQELATDTALRDYIAELDAYPWLSDAQILD